MKGAIIYDTKYGSTKRAAEELHQYIQNTTVFAVDEFNFGEQEYDFMILGCYVYDNTMSRKMLEFVEKNQDKLKQCDLFAYVMMLEGDSAQKYLQPMIKLVGDHIKLMQSFGGILKLDQLDEDDYNQIKKQFTSLYLPFKDLDLYSSEAIKTFASEINNEIMMNKRYPNSMYKQLVQQLKVINHATLTLDHRDTYPIFIQYDNLTHRLYLTPNTLLQTFENQKIELLIHEKIEPDKIELRGVLKRDDDKKNQHFFIRIEEIKWRTTQFDETQITYYLVI